MNHKKMPKHIFRAPAFEHMNCCGLVKATACLNVSDTPTQEVKQSGIRLKPVGTFFTFTTDERHFAVFEEGHS